jgi:FkbM family methyltransferase
MKALRNYCRNLLRHRGWDLVRYLPNWHPLARRMDLIERYRLDTIIDIGANIGQYGEHMRSLGFKGKIISFEPMAHAYAQLEKNCEGDKKWEAHHLGIGHFDGEAEINIAKNDVESSLLGSSAFTGLTNPNFAYLRQEKITMARLDTVLPKLTSPSDRLYLKTDTQGFEKNVIAGAEQSLSRLSTIQLEMAFIPQYEHELVFQEMYDLLWSKGYRLVSLELGHSDPDTGQLFQVDGIFHRF